MNLIAHVRRRVGVSELGGLAGDSFYTGIWLGAVSLADLAQIALVTHALGIADYGRLALVMSVVILVGQFFDVRVGTAETTFGASRIATGDWNGAAAVFRFGYGVDALTGVLGFLVVACAAPFLGPLLVGAGGTQLVLLFGVTLLLSTVDESSATALRLMGRFRLLAAYMSGLEGLRVAGVAIALLIKPGLTAVLVALVVYDAAGAAINFAIARRVFSRVSGRSLLGEARGHFADRRAMARMVVHTNIASYARIAQVQLPILLLGGLTSASQVGIYKVGTAAGAIVGRLSAPAYTAVLPRLSRLWAEQRRDDIRRVVRDGTAAAALLLGTAFVALVLLRTPILRLIGSDGAVAASPALVLAGLAYTVSGIMFWYPGLVYAVGRPGAVSVISLLTAGLQVALLVPFAGHWGATGAALALCASMVGANLIGGVLGLRWLRRPAGELDKPSTERLPHSDGSRVGLALDRGSARPSRVRSRRAAQRSAEHDAVATAHVRSNE